jgi:hypothetical protein
MSRRRPPRVPPTRRPRTIVFVPEPREDATAAERLALEIRNRATLTGRCACGAVAHFRGVDELGCGHLVWTHEPDCPAISSAARRAVGL